MTDQDLKLTLLDKSGGDVDKAKVMLAWLKEDVTTPSGPWPAPTVEGIVLTDAEVMNNTDAGIKTIAMMRLAAKQNNPGSIAVDDLVKVGG